MTITYELGDSLYVNITNRCSNDCSFCVRNEHNGVNGKDNLWLEREPTVDEIKAAITKKEIKEYIRTSAGYSISQTVLDDYFEQKAYESLNSANSDSEES